MSWTIPFMHQAQPIGVDLSGRWMKAVQYQGHRLLASVRIARKNPELPFSKADAALLAGVFQRSGFRGHRVVVAPPREHLIADVLELPPRGSGAPIEQLARMEVARTHKCDPGSFELGLWDLPAPGRGGEQSHVFAAALPFARSEPILDAFEGVGLEVQAIDVPAAALARAYGTANLPDAMLDVGWCDAMLCVVHAGAVVYERRIEEAGLQRLVAAAAARLGMAPEAVETILSTTDASAERREGTLAHELRGPISEHLELIASEAQRSLAYMSHRYQAWQFRRLAISGDGAHLSGLHDKLARALDVTAEAAERFVGACPPECLIAAGAARHGGASSVREAA